MKDLFTIRLELLKQDSELNRRLFEWRLARITKEQRQISEILERIQGGK